MFSKEIDDLLKGDNLEVLKIVAKFDPDKFKENVNSEQNRKSFFLSMIERNNSKIYVSDLLELCESFGYNLKKETTISQENFWHKNKTKDKVPEIVIILNSIRSDQSVSFLLEHLGQDYIKSLEKDGWPLLELAYSKNLPETIRTLDKFGVNYETTTNGRSMLSIAESSHNLIDLYWEITNKKQNISQRKMPEDQFNHYFEMINRKFSSVDAKRYKDIDKILDYVKEKENILSKEQKEDILLASLSIPDVRVFNFMAKMLKLKKHGDELKNLILPKLETIKNHEFLYDFINETDLIKKIKNKNGDEIYVVDILMTAFNKLSIDVQLTAIYQRNNPKNLVNQAFYSRFEKLIKEDNLLFKKIDDDETIFSRMVKNDWVKKCFSILNLSPKNYFFDSLNKLNNISNILGEETKYTEEQKVELRKVWEKTYLQKDLNGRYLFEQINLSAGSGQDFWLFNSINLKSDNCVLTISEQERLFCYVLNQNANYDIFNNMESWRDQKITNNRAINMLKTLYSNLIANEDTNWQNIVVEEENEKKRLKDSEFSFELKARKMNQSLNVDLSKKEEFKSVKFKV